MAFIVFSVVMTNVYIAKVKNMYAEDYFNEHHD